MSPQPERTLVELPFIAQLESMGWLHTPGNVDHPSVTGRDTFRDVLLRDDLVKALLRINLRDGAPWLDDHRITQAITALDPGGPARLVEANRAATERVLKGAVVDGVDGWEQGRSQTVYFIDWDHPDNNTFRVINQFRVDEPGPQGRKYIVPDLVLLVNGIPLVVIECKSPGINEPIAQAIDQLQRYANQRSHVGANEGSERLFHTNQMVVATSFDEARVATFSAEAAHYLEWKDTTPVPLAQVASDLGKERLSSQEMLVAGALRPAHLLDITRHFTLFEVKDLKTVKTVCRYQQFRAVHRAVERLHNGKTRAEDGEDDRRGGLVFHTQGSGKSLTMVFLIRKMRSDPTLRRFKIVLVTDRTQLEGQLADTAALTEEPLTVVKAERRGLRTVSAPEVLKETLRRPGKALVFAMIQKYRGPDEGPESEADAPVYPVLNESEEILVMVDEAHRSHGNKLHANLLAALPNCARIGYTGTPIIMGAKTKTTKIFGEVLDTYTIRQAEADGSTLPILYEGRTTRAAVDGGGELDQLFPDMFQGRTPEELAAIQRRYATKGDVFEAPALIAAKARDMLHHYVDNILPNGFKAQVVAVSRRATIRYREAFLMARAELVTDLELVDPAALAAASLPDERTAFLVRAHRFLPVLRELEFAPVVSGYNGDDPSWKEWTDDAKSKARVKRFKRPLFHDDPKQRDPLAILIVKSMLLTGFDAPIEQAMYLDRRIVEAELLQAIARVNRTCGATKRAGRVVDYHGVASWLSEALKAYSDEDVAGAFQSVSDELPKLAEHRRKTLEVFTSRGIASIAMQDACLDLLRDELVRADFTAKLRRFLSTLDLVLPRPAALPFVADAKALAFLQQRARNKYRDATRPIGRDVGEKVRRLIDDHIIALGVDPGIPPVSLTDPRFDEHVEREGSPKGKAGELEQALRAHTREHVGEDPVHYEALSERLESILKTFEDNWEELAAALSRLADDARGGRKCEEAGLDPETEAPFFDVLKKAFASGEELDAETVQLLARQTRQLVAQIRQALRLVGFWKNAHEQDLLRKRIVQFLDRDPGTGGELVAFDEQPDVAHELMELSRANHLKLVR